MQTLTYSAARAALAETMDRVINDHAPVVITRSGSKAVVMMSLEDYRSIEETAYLMRSPANAARLASAIAQLEAGGGTVHELIE
ncbi:type II toxin-antitoxin system prevent-host-death family antitoxin [Stenotrophomonas sp. ISL-67]|uniref:type II toxin-antitoxin system Phd/YefM family antitoxin n=1 Tax=Stenotrophomonas sp. ISL-67 TaxID=2819171 RepID=UPI001BEA8F79|nr:type II toxin-antitoxin system prevent-host-death family antitoxin [Stenotrophomonas sp. ISL-67]MBT2767908.1 type II toxin-antitoxin system prevent-host-death family antitoxin [Stenotrophomonas sp. ISL-67]